MLTFHDVCLDSLCSDTRRSYLPEKRFQMIPALINVPYCLSFTDLIVLFHERGEIVEADMLSLGSTK